MSLIRCLHEAIVAAIAPCKHTCNRSRDRSRRSVARPIAATIAPCKHAITLQLIQSKSVPLLLYGLEACPLNKSQLNSIDFVINRFFMKLFKTSDRNTVEICQEKFGFVLPSIQLDKRRKKFEENYVNTCDMYI